MPNDNKGNVMKHLCKIMLFTLPWLAAFGQAQAQEVSSSAIDKTQFVRQFAPLGVVVYDVTESDIPNLLEVHTNSGVLFASPDGQYFVAGTLYKMTDNGGYEDVLAKRQAPLNAQKIAKMSDHVIEYKADDEKYAVTVFTDITCGYCSRLHSQMQQYNDLGITVRYMAFPRQGGVGEVADQMAAIWCADDPVKAMNLAEQQRTIPDKTDQFAQCQSWVKQDYELGRDLGINGTPAIFLPNGEMVGGYLPPAELLQHLQQTQ